MAGSEKSAIAGPEKTINDEVAGPAKQLNLLNVMNDGVKGPGSDGNGAVKSSIIKNGTYGSAIDGTGASITANSEAVNRNVSPHLPGLEVIIPPPWMQPGW